MDWFFIVTNSLYSSWKTQNFEYFPLECYTCDGCYVVLVCFDYFPSHLLRVLGGEKKVISWSKYFQRNKNTSITIYKQLRYTDIHRPKYIFFTEKLRRFFCSHLHISLWYIFSLYFVFHHHIIILVVDMFSREGIKIWDGTKHFMLFTHQNDNYYSYISF